MPRTAIVVRIEDSSGLGSVATIGVGDLVPLLAPIDSVLWDIHQSGGPLIDKRRLTMSEQIFPLTSIGEQILACALMAEQTMDATETAWLQRARRRGISSAFSDLIHYRQRSLDRTCESPAMARAAFLLACAYETATLAKKCGPLTRKVGEFTFLGSCEDVEIDAGRFDLAWATAGSGLVSGTVH